MAFDYLLFDHLSHEDEAFYLSKKESSCNEHAFYLHVALFMGPQHDLEHHALTEFDTYFTFVIELELN